jgi:foldase protein PrsA
MVRKKQLWLVIAALIALNCLTVIFFLSKANEANGAMVNDEVVASIGKSTISRKVWSEELVARYGKDVLQDMVDQKVIKEMAEKYKITIADKDVEQEFRNLQTTYNPSNKNKNEDEKKQKEKIRNNLLLEEILTKDVVVSEKELKSYYDNNKQPFNVPTAYHLSHIIVKTKNEAKTALKELTEGSNFSALAMERSIEEFSANEGGDIGYISEDDEQYPSSYIKNAKKMKVGAYSEPIKVEQGYALLKLEGNLKGKEYSYGDVKNQIRRQIALEQMKLPASARTFWDEAKVEWFYGNKDSN